MNPFIRKCTCGKMIPPPASKVDDDGNCEYCADDVSNSTRSMKIQNTIDACIYVRISAFRCGKTNKYQSVYAVPDEDLPWD